MVREIVEAFGGIGWLGGKQEMGTCQWGWALLGVVGAGPLGGVGTTSDNFGSSVSLCVGIRNTPASGG